MQVRGFVILSLGIMLLIVGVVGVLLTNMLTASSRATIDQLRSTQAFYVAEAGLELASSKFINGTLTCANINGDASLTNANGGFSSLDGVFYR